MNVDELADEVKQLEKICETFKTILKGDPTSDTPDGLVHMVYENTKFRNRFSRINTFILLTVLGLAIKAMLELLGIL